MPGGSGRKLIAEHAGAAFPGALVAGSAGNAAKASDKPIAATIVVCIVLSPVAKLSLILRQAARQEVELTKIETGSRLSGRVRSAEFD
jgi:hypothetical protein